MVINSLKIKKNPHIYYYPKHKSYVFYSYVSLILHVFKIKLILNNKCEKYNSYYIPIDT